MTKYLCILLPAGMIAATLMIAAPSAVPAGESATAAASSESSLFDRLDTNRDGQLTADEVAQDKRRLFLRLLRTADKDHSGGLSRDEFSAGLEEKRSDRPLEEKSPAGMGGPGGLPDPEELFQRLDVNKDGIITLEEIPEEGRQRFQALMARSDKNGDGKISKDELTAGIGSISGDIKAVAEQARDPHQIFKYLDSDGDGKLAPSEAPEGRREGLEKMLKIFDKDGDGKLDEEEFVAAMRVVRPQPDEKETAKPVAAPPEKGDPDKANQAPGKPDRGPNPGGGRAALDPDQMAARLMQLDKNKDGKISREEATGPFSERFDKFDTNNDGFVDEREIRERAAKIKAFMNKSKALNRGQAGSKRRR